ncbi:MAG: hypothetical protein ABJC05_03325 [Pyrinomonadaceae bacterium]
MKSFSRIIVSTKSNAETEFPQSPHFDDETTLLRAQPVVPIEKPVDRWSVRTYLVTGIIIVAAAITGAAVAMSANYFQNHRRSDGAIATPLSASTSDAAVSEIPQTPATTPQSSAAVPNKTTSAQTDSNVPAPIDTKETKPVTNGNQVQKKSSGNEIVAEGTKAVEKRSEPSDQQRRIAKVRRSVDSPQDPRRPRDAASIREIFEGPSPF